MRFHADLHIHSKYSLACSKDCDLEHLTWWARRKGITLLGTGDFTHPAWFDHLRECLVTAEPGLFRLRDDLERDVSRTLPPALAARPVRFLLSVEISTIYKRDDRTRKVHHLVYLPGFDEATEFNRALGRIGNIGSDGRPILGLDSRDLLEITLASGDGGYLVPAHVWTPWFAVLGSKSGFDAIEDCYADLAGHIFALETGLSADPAMMWRVSGLDPYHLVSFSDAHSPPIIGREATILDTELDFFAVRRAFETGAGHLGTVEFFPEEGKYHVDGHRKCGVRLEPSRTRELGGRCPECGGPLTVGVLSRVEELADRPEGFRRDGAPGFQGLVQLPQILGEILGVGPKSKRVHGEINQLTAALGPELDILREVPLGDIATRSTLLAEAVARLRRGEVIREPGYDGEYGVVRLFEPDELKRAGSTPTLFDESPFDQSSYGARAAVPQPNPGSRSERAERPEGTAPRRAARTSPPAATGLLDGLDPDQRAVAEITEGPLLIIAGPGTGKTRTLTHRMAHLVTAERVPPEQCLAITFTRRAAEEMAERLAALAPDHASALTITTFHALGVRILRERYERAGLTASFGIASEAQRLALATEITGTEKVARRLLEDRTQDGGDRYVKELRRRDLVDFDDLITIPVELLESDPELAAAYRARYRWISVDEYQDVDERQYRLLRLLAPPDGNLTAIGDPDQAIYRFRGADVGFFLRFQEDFPGARIVRLTRNYRSSANILSAAQQVISPASLVPDRELRALGDHGDALVGIHHAADEHAEAAFVARTIDRVLGGTSLYSLDSGRVDSDGTQGLGFSDFAVLYRTGRQARAVMEALTQAGLPYQKRSHDRLTDRPGVERVLAELAGVPSAGPLEDRVRRAAGAILDRLSPEAEAEINTAVDLLKPLALRCGDDLSRFRTELALGVEVDTWDPRADRISLLTLHAAKGLEFPVVFVVGCEDGLLPLRWPGSRPDEEEERRLLFVGMTRARLHLYISHAAQRTWQGAVRRNARSPFLNDPASGVWERIGEKAPRRRPKDTQLRLI